MWQALKEAVSENWFVIAIYAAMMVLVVAGWVGHSYMEARAYNRITGANVSTADAMFIQLRVQEGAK